MAESMADKLKALDKQRAEILDAFVKEHQALIKQKKDELARLEGELQAVLAPGTSSRKRRSVKASANTVAKAPAKAKNKADGAKLPPDFSPKELAGIIEGLKEGIKEAAELKQFVGKGRRTPLINKAIEAYKSLNPKERSVEALEAAIKDLKSKKPE